MSQTVISVVMEVQPRSVGRLRSLIADLRRPVGAAADGYAHLQASVPTLHFMSLTVFADDQYDPIFVIEANFDGPAEAFWQALDAAIGAQLRDMFRCGKTPRDRNATLFHEVTKDGASDAVAPLLGALSVRPAVFHQGNRGLSRDRIEREGALFLDARAALEAAPPAAGASAADIHRTLRATLVQRHPWLAAAAPARVPLGEGLADLARLTAFVVIVLAVLGLPSALAGLVLQARSAWAWSGLATASGLVCVGVIVAWLRWLEQRDPGQDEPPLDQAMLREIARAEDKIAQNHMISIVHLKPGVLRAVLIRVGLWGLGLLLRVTARDGYLASMRTIHFAHWALVSNGGRLMFHSNFDGSWESYLDDFIEKAHAGLTLAWSSGVGFPATRFLILDGATQGRKFKAWARHSMAPSAFWFSAYKSFTVNQIERHARIAAGLRRASLGEKEAQVWALDL